MSTKAATRSVWASLRPVVPELNETWIVLGSTTEALAIVAEDTAAVFGLSFDASWKELNSRSRMLFEEGSGGIAGIAKN